MRRHSAAPEPLELPWASLAQWLTTPNPVHCPKEELGCWVPIQSRGRRTIEDTISVQALVFDLDTYREGDKSNSANWLQPQHIQDVHARLQACGLSYVWHTSYSYNPAGPLKYRFVIELSEPVSPALADGDKKGLLWRAFWQLCAQTFCPQPDNSSGTFADTKCADVPHLYYMPAYPADGPPPDCGIHPGQPLHTPTILAEARKAAPAGASHGVHKAPDAPTTVTEQDLRRILPKHPERVGNEFVRLGWMTLQNLCERRPYAENGKRDNAMFALANLLATQFPYATPQALTDIFRFQIDTTYSDEPNSHYLEKKIERAQTQLKDQLSSEDPIRMAQIGRSGPYTAEEIEQYLTELKLASIEHFVHQLIVEHKGDLYVFYNGDYVFAGSKDTAENYILQRLTLCTNLPNVSLREIGAKGVVDKTLKKLCKDYGTAVRTVVPSFEVQTSYVDHAKETLIHAICPRRKDLKPVYHAEVAAWLAGIEPHEKLLDYLATLPKLERPTCALFMHGGRHTGKSLLASGAAIIWGDSPTELASMGVNFNGDITSNPVVFADETLPEEYKRDTGLLRRMITAHSVKLRRKYMQESNLQGATRIMIAKNNLDLFTGNEESLTSEDIDAIAERILYVRMGGALRSGNPHQVAEHILWLEQTRAPNVVSQDRLWVSGQDSPLHKALRVTSRQRSLVCQWLMEFIQNPTQVGDSKRFFRMDEMGLQIAPGLIYERWDSYCAKERPPIRRDVCRVIEEIGIKRGNLYQIRLADLEQYGSTHGYNMSVEDLAKACGAGGAVMVRSAN
jgi:hypothetical protein